MPAGGIAHVRVPQPRPSDAIGEGSGLGLREQACGEHAAQARPRGEAGIEGSDDAKVAIDQGQNLGFRRSQERRAEVLAPEAGEERSAEACLPGEDGAGEEERGLRFRGQSGVDHAQAVARRGEEAGVDPGGVVVLGHCGHDAAGGVGQGDPRKLRVLPAERGEQPQRRSAAEGAIDLDAVREVVEGGFATGQHFPDGAARLCRGALDAGIGLVDARLIGRARIEHGQGQRGDHHDEQDAIENVLSQARGEDRVAGRQDPGHEREAEHALGEERVRDAVQDLLDEEEGQEIAAPPEQRPVDHEVEQPTRRQPEERDREDEAPEAAVEQAGHPRLEHIERSGQRPRVESGKGREEGESGGQKAWSRTEAHECREDGGGPEKERRGLMLSVDRRGSGSARGRTHPATRRANSGAGGRVARWGEPSLDLL